MKLDRTGHQKSRGLGSAHVERLDPTGGPKEGRCGAVACVCDACVLEGVLEITNQSSSGRCGAIKKSRSESCCWLPGGLWVGVGWSVLAVYTLLLCALLSTHYVLLTSMPLWSTYARFATYTRYLYPAH